MRSCSAEGELDAAYEDAVHSAVLRKLGSRLAKHDRSEKVEEILREMKLEWHYGPALDGVHCIYSASRPLRGRASIGIEVFVALEDNAWRFSRFTVTAHHPFI